MNNFPSFFYHHKKNSDTLDIVLQGGKYGIDTPFMQKVIKVLNEGKNSVMAFNFLYYERGETHSSGEELLEELDTLKVMLNYAKADDYKQIRFVAKSLGGIVASYYLNKLTENEMEKYSLVILGYVTGALSLKRFSGPITIIQGEKDDHGGIKKVKESLKNANSKKIKYFEIKGADHSFKDQKTDEPRYQDEAINILISL